MEISLFGGVSNVSCRNILLLIDPPRRDRQREKLSDFA